jgi:tripartite-type tricarboxylate transporter receptor subunit TctC
VRRERNRDDTIPTVTVTACPTIRPRAVPPSAPGVLARVLVAVLAIAAGAASAQAWPDRPLRLVAAAPPGSGLDLTMRTLAERLHADLGVNAIVENKAGADGILAAQQVAAAAADGMTLLAGSPAQMTINPVLRTDLSYVPVRDFVPVSLVSQVPLVLVVLPGVGAQSVRELVALARSRPLPLDYGSGSSTFMFATELFARRAGIALRQVPYNGIPPVVAALLAGDVQVGLVNVPPALAHLRSGRLRALAVTGAAREPSLPDVPTLAEAGVAGYDFSVWVGLFAPAGTPPERVAQLNAAIAKALEAADVRERLTASGIVPVASTPVALADTVRRERALVESVAREAGIVAR